MNVIIGCEESGKVRDAFIRRGHRAVSCDILPSRRPGPHFMGRLEDFIYSEKWDMGIFFPPCTYICSSGLHWNKRRPERAKETELGLQFVCYILNSGIPKIGLENPVGCIPTRIACVNGIWQVMPLESQDNYPRIKKLQTIQPHQFGEDASKATCIFAIGNIPKLRPTKLIPVRIEKRQVKTGG